jgi:hypothetical protein
LVYKTFDARLSKVCSGILSLYSLALLYHFIYYLFSFLIQCEMRSIYSVIQGLVKYNILPMLEH